MGDYTVYIHTNRINNKKYVGLTKQQNPERRWGKDGVRYKQSPYFYSAIQKYVCDNFDHDIVASDLQKEEACDMEIQLIQQYKTQDKQFGYNIMEGGSAPQIPDEIKEQMQQRMLGNTYCAGRVTSEETKKKISDAQKGRKLTEEHRQKLRKPKSVTYPCSKEHRQHIIEAKKDKKSVRCVETGIVYESIHECARQMGVSATAICAVARGRHKTAGGYRFEYNDR